MEKFAGFIFKALLLLVIGFGVAIAANSFMTFGELRLGMDLVFDPTTLTIFMAEFLLIGVYLLDKSGKDDSFGGGTSKRNRTKDGRELTQ